jgi:hypothetical protein
MDVRFQFLRQSSEIGKTLRDDGWQVETEGNNYLSAHHPEAPNEFTARTRLLKLGLLTSSSLRIEFRKPFYPIDQILGSTLAETKRS